MISLSKVAPQAAGICLSKAAPVFSKAISGVNTNAPINLNSMPHYKILPESLLKCAKESLEAFGAEFGEIKSATYICEKIKQAKGNGCSEEILDNLQKTRQDYSKKVKALRRDVWQKPISSFEEYISKLKRSVKKNGSYMNCNECADLILDDLLKKGANANNVFIHTVNSEGRDVSHAEHVFTIIGLDLNKGARIEDPATWGNAIVCDGWAGFAKPCGEALEFYKDFFNVDGKNHKFAFEFCNKNFDMQK